MKMHRILSALLIFCTIPILAMEMPTDKSQNEPNKMSISTIVNPISDSEALVRQLNRYAQMQECMTFMAEDFAKQQKKRKVTEVIDEFNQTLKEKKKFLRVPIKELNVSSIHFDLPVLNNAINALYESIDSNTAKRIVREYKLLRFASSIKWQAERLNEHYKLELTESDLPAEQITAKFTQLFKDCQNKWNYPYNRLNDIKQLPQLTQNLDILINRLEKQVSASDAEVQDK